MYRHRHTTNVFAGARSREAGTPPAIRATLKRHGIDIPHSGKQWTVAALDGFLRARNVSIEDRLIIKSMLRQVDALE
jgi:hypothetical protein